MIGVAAGDIETAEPIDTLHSASWPTTVPQVSVVIATHNRADYLGGLFAALEQQIGAPPYEIVIADDGSTDRTWATLAELVAATPLPVLALQLRGCGGPSVPRNSAVHHTRSQLLAVTDDDCLPTPGWLAAMSAAVEAGGIVQGATVPDDEGRVGPWDRTIDISRLSGLWESCNLALPRATFDAAGGFPVLDLLPAAGRGFGEDTVLGAAAARLAGATWAPAAVVRHRWIRSDYRGYLDTRRRLAGMPALLREVPELRSQCFLGSFLNRRSAECDLAVLGLLLATSRRRPAYALVAAPWLRTLATAAAARWGRARAARMAQEGVADLVAMGALARGSISARSVVL